MLATRVSKGRLALTVTLIPLLLLLNSCTVLYRGWNQNIPISTEPIGIEVYLNGEFMGVTPLELQVWRGQEHELLLRYGEQERVVVLEPEFSSDSSTGLGLDAIPAVALTALIIVAPCDGGSSYDDLCATLNFTVIGIGVGISALAFTIDWSTGAINTLNPGEVHEVFEVTQP